MIKNDSVSIDENVRYIETSKKISETAKENFHKTRLETDEEIQAIISSDVACVTLSDKRAYFRGNYIGADMQSRPQGDNVNLSSIRNVYMQNRRRKPKTPDKIVKILILCIIFLSILSCILVSNQKKAYALGEIRERQYEQRKSITTGPPSGYSSLDVIEYFAAKESNNENFKEDPILEQAQKDAENREQNLRSIQREASEAYNKANNLKTAYVFSIVVLMILIIYTIIRTVQHMDKYTTMQFVCDNKELGIEIRDKSNLDKVKNILLVAKSATQPKTPEVVQQNIRKDKVGSLSELSKLHEQGLLSEEEFNKLKAEIINN